MTEKFIYFVLKLLDMSTCEVMQERFDSLDKISPQIINKNKVTISCLSFFKEFLPCQWFSGKFSGMVRGYIIFEVMNF